METRIKQEQRYLIFRSTIRTSEDVQKVERVFSQIDEIRRWSVDLDDWEKVMKVESRKLSYQDIETIVRSLGFSCRKLEH